ncbi:MBL fold metallo-hydrolase [Maribellus sp. CM-23]|uniref:MBL fold metallo-hydrolase n=1 Tax=Maribellus sp. CM-23 TaxID=2781026 RepID=UPI001F248025|nr:MBL fold metallo-hydrolase [Maribellus sp. CM-23]MCE4563802.1 MBL fold metallo-hydrolase [Maribellus sp. CM-23]
MKKIILIMTIIASASIPLKAAEFEKDVFKTSEGELAITFIGHGTLMLEFNGKVIHVDPVSQYADYESMPKADLVLITHEHGDHLDPKAIDAVKKESTRIVLTESCSPKYTGTDVMKNGDTKVFGTITVEAVPAYNIRNTRADGTPFHPKGRGNGYVIRFADKKVYIAGDTENIPEMAELVDIDVAFLPVNLPYTMTPEMCTNAARLFHPKVLYPYHFGETDTGELVKLLENDKDIEVRLRKLN